MRRNLLTTIALLVLMFGPLQSGNLVSQENRFADWPFDSAGGNHQISPEAVQWQTLCDVEQPWLLRSPLASISWPNVELPQFEIFPQMYTRDHSLVLGQNGTTPLGWILGTPRRIFEHTKSAWNRSLEMLMFRRSAQPQRQSTHSSRTPWLGKLFGAGTEPIQEGPLTINEWMSQDRLDP